MPFQPLALRKSIATSQSPVCMSTTVPYWSNMQTVMLRLISAGSVTSVLLGSAAGEWAAVRAAGKHPLDWPEGTAGRTHTADQDLVGGQCGSTPRSSRAAALPLS